MKTILVTGGAGYVGSHCCKAFSEAGWAVVVYDDLSTGWRDMVKWGEFIHGSILDQSSLTAAFESVRPDAVAHFAASLSVEESVSDPSRYYTNNVVGSYNVLEGMRRYAVDNIIVSSTAATYGSGLNGEICEDSAQLPINPYGNSKLAVERMVQDYSLAYGMRHVILRYFNAAGADVDGEIGERHSYETHIIPLCIQAALNVGREFRILGADYDTRDGTCVRDFVHVTDLGAAHRVALEHVCAGGAGGSFNVGSGAGVSVAEVVSAVERVLGKPLEVRVGPRRIGDPKTLVASIKKIKEALGWEPRFSSLEHIIETAAAWHLKDCEKTMR